MSRRPHPSPLKGRGDMSRRPHPKPLPKGEETRNLVVVINPGSTSTKLAIYRGLECLASETIDHPKEELAKFACVADQYTFRRDAVLEFLAERGVNLDEVVAVAGRGGLTKPIPGGVYRVNAKLIRDLRMPSGASTSNLGAPLRKTSPNAAARRPSSPIPSPATSIGRCRAMRAIRPSAQKPFARPLAAGRRPAGRRRTGRLV